MKAGIWIDSQLVLEKWQLEAIKNVKYEKFEITRIFALGNQKKRRKVLLSTFLYYSTLGIQRKFVGLARKVSVASINELRNIQITLLEHESEGNWERLTSKSLEDMQGLDVIIKLDGSLIRNPEEAPVPFGIISYHHGNPAFFRGRPAIFWEMYSKSQDIGIIIQQLSSQLDSGKVIAQATLKLKNYSYRQNYSNLYLISIFMLSKAIDNLIKQRKIEIEPCGSLFRLPSNSPTVRVLLTLCKNKILFILYGLFRQKQWWIAKIPIPKHFDSEIVIGNEELTKLKKPATFYFFADPMVDSDGLIYAEVVRWPRYRGEVFVFKDRIWKKVEFKTSLPGHYSYPQVISDAGTKYLFAETAFHSSPHLLKLSSNGDAITDVQFLKGLESERIADGTLFKFEENWFLFGCSQKSNYSILHLWISASLDGEFHEHVSSPVCLNVREQRMGGPILNHEGAYIRFGQDCLANYGSSLKTMMVMRLSPDDYHEIPIGRISYVNGLGPHTFSRVGEIAYVDGYKEFWTIFAVLRRLLSRLRI